MNTSDEENDLLLATRLQNIFNNLDEINEIRDRDNSSSFLSSIFSNRSRPPVDLFGYQSPFMLNQRNRNIFDTTDFLNHPLFNETPRIQTSYVIFNSDGSIRMSNSGERIERQGLFSNLFSNLARGLNMEDVTIALKDEELNALKKGRYYDIKIKNPDLAKYTTCNICLDEYNDDSNCIILPCQHIYHNECITKWLGENSNKCPVCKKEVAPGEPKNI